MSKKDIKKCKEILEMTLVTMNDPTIVEPETVAKNGIKMSITKINNITKTADKIETKLNEILTQLNNIDEDCNPIPIAKEGIQEIIELLKKE